jgi:hypothetical protein
VLVYPLSHGKISSKPNEATLLHWHIISICFLH